MSKTPPSADDYRKRAAAIGKRLKHIAKNDKKRGRELLRRKQQALLALADNEDWLAAKSKRRKNRRRKCDGASAPPRRFERPTPPVDGSGCKVVQPGTSAGFSQ